jgi:bifunctional DNA-binding transcriptional regulator/antitoxin component of YhaV-PrlF toxin-antitoxin module
MRVGAIRRRPARHECDKHVKLDARFGVSRYQGLVLDVVLDECQYGVVAKVTGKLQITLPKALAEQCGIRVGDELELRPIGRSIQIDKRSLRDASRVRRERLVHFDGATARQRARERTIHLARARSRGWTRAELYTRARAR